MSTNELRDVIVECYELGVAHDGGDYEPLRGPASAAHIDLAEQQLGVSFTDDLRQLYLAVDGGLFLPHDAEFASVNPANSFEVLTEQGIIGSELVQDSKYWQQRDHLWGNSPYSAEERHNVITLSDEGHVGTQYDLSARLGGHVIGYHLHRPDSHFYVAETIESYIRCYHEIYQLDGYIFDEQATEVAKRHNVRPFS